MYVYIYKRKLYLYIINYHIRIMPLCRATGPTLPCNTCNITGAWTSNAATYFMGKDWQRRGMPGLGKFRNQKEHVVLNLEV